MRSMRSLIFPVLKWRLLEEQRKNGVERNQEKYFLIQLLPLLRKDLLVLKSLRMLNRSGGAMIHQRFRITFNILLLPLAP